MAKARLEQRRKEAAELDAADTLAFTRDEFLIPSTAQIAGKKLASSVTVDAEGQKSTYLCGNSLGLQPKRTATRIHQYLTTWGTQGVQGHFKVLDGSPLPTWLDADARAAELIAPIVGAQEPEVAVMQTLTGNLHLLMSAFYRPDPNGRHKIILEAKAFPSDHFAVETQLRHHNLSNETSMVLIEPPSPEESSTVSTEHILSVIEKHASSTALLLLPGIQYYTGQLFDIPTITAFAQKHGIFVIWDLAHAVGNVPLALHDWNVDAAAWCTYKYLNSGPGCIGGMFVHSRHSTVTTAITAERPQEGYTNRLAGWWGNDKKSRFVMATKFHPVAGAAGFQLSNPSILDITSLTASLEVFALAGGVAALRKKSLKLTAFLEVLLQEMADEEKALYKVITPTDPQQRGAQLSLKLSDGLLDTVMHELEARGVIVDERRPDVIRVAPAPLYNNHSDCVSFVDAFSTALKAAKANPAK
ncbi:kynureninase 1 [Thozetella sp. PMI_491]|nr:kynureninase 1 [Thozetella sp. PMI_491]